MNKKLTILMKYLILICLFNLSGLANAELPPINELKSFLSNSKTMMADFKQVSFDEFGNPLQKSYGVFYLQRPGRFRWDYRSPFVQQIISNSEKVWFFDEDLEQVTVKNLDQSLGSTPALLLSGEMSLEENFTMQKQGQDEGMHWIKLLPKNDQSGFNYILIGMQNKIIGGMELSDNFGQLTRIYFSKIQINTAIAPEIFQFVAPEGVDVFEDQQ